MTILHASSMLLLVLPRCSHTSDATFSCIALYPNRQHSMVSCLILLSSIAKRTLSLASEATWHSCIPILFRSSRACFAFGARMTFLACTVSSLLEYLSKGRSN